MLFLWQCSSHSIPCDASGAPYLVVYYEVSFKYYYSIAADYPTYINNPSILAMIEYSIKQPFNTRSVAVAATADLIESVLC